MTTDDGSIGDPAIPVEGPDVPPYIRLEDGRMTYSFAAQMKEGELYPLDHLMRGGETWEQNTPRSIDDIRGTPKISEADTKEMLDAFVSIQSEGDILRFARKYGVLELCEHDIPVEKGHGVPCRPRGWPGLYWEPVDSWMRLVREARAVLMLVAAINQENPTSADDWAAIASIDFLWEPSVLARDPVSVQKKRLDMVVNSWLSIGLPQLTYSSSTQILGFDGGVISVIAVQLMFAVSNSQRLAVCNGCGHPYNRARKPQKGRNNYCQTCKDDGVDARLRKRKERGT